MLKKTLSAVMVFVFAVNICGCAALLIGAGAAAGGAGATIWAGGKLKYDIDAPLIVVIRATTKAMNSLKLPITKTTTKIDIAQIKGRYSDRRTIWIDIHYVSDSSSVIEIRVGIRGDDEASRRILDKILAFIK